MSCGNPLRGRSFDPFALKRRLPEEWGRFLRAHFRSPAEVAVFFDTSVRTAEYWWSGDHTGGAVHMAIVAAHFPAAFDEMMRRAA